MCLWEKFLNLPLSRKCLLRDLVTHRRRNAVFLLVIRKERFDENELAVEIEKPISDGLSIPGKSEAQRR